ncbi:MAG TPA: hypothetical protein PKA58_19900 [Polyangium sp.]|nr:hypothetical protein [Polyangium sp.]
MTRKQRSDLLSSLRAMDEHWGHAEPDPAFEQRLLARLHSTAKKNRASFPLFSRLRQTGRPLMLLAAAAAVLILSVTDDVPKARSGLIFPQAPDAAVEPVESPADERDEPANPHFDNKPENPRLGPDDPRDPLRLEEQKNRQPVFPAQPDSDSEYEPTWPVPRMRVPLPHHSPLKSNTQVHSNSFLHWSPGQMMSTDTQSRNSLNSTMRGGGGSSQTKHPPVTSTAECLPKETLKKRAAADCEENGLTLLNILYLNPCKDDLYQHAEHECTDIPPDEDPCTTGTVSDGDQCVDPGQLKMLAYTACKMAMMDLVDLTYVSGDCGWKTRQATYTCCPYPPSPPVPPMLCQGEIIGDGTTCMDPAAMKDEAFYHCQNLGQTLVDITPAGDCADGQSTYAKIACCKQ